MQNIATSNLSIININNKTSNSQLVRISGFPSTKSGFLCAFGGLEPPFSVSVSAITCHQYKESRVSGPAILSSICLGGDLGMLRSLNREAKRLFC